MSTIEPVSRSPTLLSSDDASPPASKDSEKHLDTMDRFADAKSIGVKPVFMAKCEVINEAIREIGMGRYQYELFFTAGFGWFADNIWLQGVAILLPAIANEWRDSRYVKLLTLSLYAGLIVGATFWGCSADIVGRRFAWNATLAVGGLFGLVSGAAPSFAVLGVFIAFLGFGTGGNLPVDGTMFIEFIPGKQQWLLTLLSLWWAVGQVVGSLIVWVFQANYGCATPPPGEHCRKEDNMGWRYAFYTLGAMMLFLWGVRFLVLPVYESPKFLISIGRDEEAVEVIHKVAKRNGKTTTLSSEDLKAAAAPYIEGDTVSADTVKTKLSTMELLKNSFDDLKGEHVKSLFSTPRLAYSTSLVIFCYAALGLAYPLYNSFLGTYLAARNVDLGTTSVDATYAQYTYQAACGVPGSIAAAFLVEWGRGGRKFAMAFFTAGAGLILFGLTQAKTPVQVNALTCIAAFFQNAFYGVLYGYAPEVFPTPSRGTGDALAAASSRITGIFAPVIAIWSSASNTPNGPVFASASIYVVTGAVMLLLPIETRGKTAL